MPDSEIIPDSFVEFAEQMKSLTDEAQRKMHEVKERQAEPAVPNLSHLLHPILLAIQALGRATEENTRNLAKVTESLKGHEELPGLLSEVRDTLQQKHAINQQLFDALHAELKDYKDGFLLNVMQKPVILDLIGLFDDLETVSRQMADFARSENFDAKSQDDDTAATLSTNLDHTIGTLLEVLERMEVTRLEPSIGQQLDKATHKAVKVEIADSEERENEIADSLKYGFKWKERIVRPEEVTILKYKEGYLTALPSSQSKNSHS